MKNFLQEYFYYTRQERNGALALAILCILCVLAPRLYPFFINRSAAPDMTTLRKAAESLAAEGDADLNETVDVATTELFPFDPNTASKEDFVLLGLSDRTAQTILNYRSKGGKFFKPVDFKKIYALREADYLRLEPFIEIGGSGQSQYSRQYPDRAPKAPAESFAFDPNTADEKTLIRLGLSERVAKVILNYRSKGGRFRKKEDLAKIYSLPEADYKRLESYIQIGASPEIPAAKAPTEKPAEAPVVIDINQASAEDWQRLKGVGPAFAKRIVGYREKLGGFASIAQIAETYGLPDSVFQKIKPQLQASPVFRPIQINTATITDLEAHPYLSRRQAEGIAAYRANHGSFKNFEDVQKVKALPAEVQEKIKAYLAY